MSKAHRGKGLRGEAARGRGECPVCKRNNVKVLYEQDAGEIKVKICKVCRAAVKHGTKSVIHAGAGKPAPAESSGERSAPQVQAAPEAPAAETTAGEAAPAQESGDAPAAE
jgi:hypothetical protein